MRIGQPCDNRNLCHGVESVFDICHQAQQTPGRAPARHRVDRRRSRMLPILISTAWLTVMTFVVAVCAAASYGDRAVRGEVTYTDLAATDAATGRARGRPFPQRPRARAPFAGRSRVRRTP